MKTHMLRIAGLTALIASSGLAQLAAPLTADVPFDFTVGTTKLTAGQYMIHKQQNGVLRVSGRDNKQSVMILAMTSAKLMPQTETKLVFNRYGNQHFLSRIWVAGQTDGFQLRPGSIEREVAHSVHNSDDVSIIARGR
ncbi:MAG: hypothetical protein ACRD8O_10515 [Bryobacteraceae bacterium]